MKKVASVISFPLHLMTHLMKQLPSHLVLGGKLNHPSSPLRRTCPRLYVTNVEESDTCAQFAPLTTQMPSAMLLKKMKNLLSLLLMMKMKELGNYPFYFYYLYSIFYYYAP